MDDEQRSGDGAPADSPAQDASADGSAQDASSGETKKADAEPKKPVGWTCPLCGLYCERDWVTCPACDFVRPLDYPMDDEYEG